MANHERVVVGELAVQGLDEGWDLRAGLADGEARQLPGVAFPGDEGFQDRPAAHARDIGQHRGELHVSSSSFSSR
ncbi:hypothetical protein ACWGI9_40990 [Streptomyces sp. NPDC054833]